MRQTAAKSRRPYLQLLAIAALAGLALLLSLLEADGASAQAPQLTLDDFDDAGLDVEPAVLILTNSAIQDGKLWARGRFGEDGDLLDGGTNSKIPMLSAPAHPDDPSDTEGNLIRIRRNNSGSSITINDDGDLVLSEYFGSGGAGNGLRIYFQTLDDGVSYVTVSDTGVLGNTGGGYATFNLDTDTENLVNAITASERFIFALARVQPNRAPEFDGSSTVRTVSEGATAGANVGSAVAATDDDTTDTLEYSISGDSNFTIVSTSGQIQVAANADLDYESDTSHEVTVTATDGVATASIDVTINVTNVDEAGSVAFSASQPSSGTALTATLSDPDGSLSGITWQWASSGSATGTFSDINNATSASYTPDSGDVGCTCEPPPATPTAKVRERQLRRWPPVP